VAGWRQARGADAADVGRGAVLPVGERAWRSGKRLSDGMTGGDLLRAFLAHPAIRLYAALAVLALAATAALSPEPAMLLLVAAIAIPVYTVVEYMLHRHVLHGRLYRREATAALWKRVHYDHHSDPGDLTVLFGDPCTTLPPILLIAVPAGYVVHGWAGAAFGVFCGIALTSLYELCHFSQHVPYEPPGAYLRRLKRRHLAHHFHNETGNFGITSHLCDLAFGTSYDAPRERPRSATARSLGYDGEEAARYPWVARLGAAATAVEIVRVDTRRLREAFIRLPWSLYGDDPNWVPPLLAEERRRIGRAGADDRRALWIARIGGRVVGRISAQLGREPEDGRFGWIEAIDSAAVFDALFAAAEGWLAARGATACSGPYSFTINEECGLLVDGYETPPMIMMPHARPYYAAHLERLGYAKAMDLLAYRIDAADPPPERTARLARRATEDLGVTLRGTDRRRFTADVRVVLDLFNDAWAGNWGFEPFSPARIGEMAASLRPLLPPDAVCIAEQAGRPVAFALGLPNLNEMIRDLDGRLFPFGWARLLYRIRTGRYRSARLALMGVRREFQSSPTGAALAIAVMERLRTVCLGRGVRDVELSWVLETNRRVRTLLEAFGARPYKTYRLYSRPLDPR
jgi:sterol desaturase/sphingolipid hydroxylase (fatty acid hydroxylase superfamily)